MDIKFVIDLAEGSITEIFTKPSIGSGQSVGIIKGKVNESLPGFFSIFNYPTHLVKWAMGSSYSFSNSLRNLRFSTVICLVFFCCAYHNNYLWCLDECVHFFVLNALNT